MKDKRDDRPLYGILKGREIVPVSMKEFGPWFESSIGVKKEENPRLIARTEFAEGIAVSTVFLGINHALHWHPRDIWFETMVFGGVHDGFQCRYSTYEEAEQGHDRTVKMVKCVFVVDDRPGGK